MFTAFLNLLSLISGSVWFLAGYLGFEKSFPRPLLPNEEKKYIKLLSNGDENARNTLIEHNLRLVAHIAKKYYQTTADNEDLISIGTIGLIKAVSSFNEDKNIRLATYAARCIENEILMYLRSAKKQLCEVSLNESIGTDRDGNEIALMDIIEDTYRHVDDEVELNILSQNLKNYIDLVLSDREKQIIIWRYGIGGGRSKTQNEIADLLDISRSYVSRIEKKAVNKLKSAMKNEI